jgi:hypothetical protein
MDEELELILQDPRRIGDRIVRGGRSRAPDLNSIAETRKAQWVGP